MKNPKAADPKRAIHTALLNPRKGFLDSFKSLFRRFGSKLDSGLLELIKNKFNYLDVLINNAGIMAPPKTLSKQGFEIQFAVNHLAHMLLTLELLPMLKEKNNSRVVTVTSGVQYFGKIQWDDLQGNIKYDRWASYAQSKLANVMFGLELNSKLKRSRS